MGFFLRGNWGMRKERIIHLSQTISCTHLINFPPKKDMHLNGGHAQVNGEFRQKSNHPTCRHVAASSQSQVGMWEIRPPWSNMKWRRIAIAPTGHLNGLRCGKTKLYFGSVFYNSNKNVIKTKKRTKKWNTPGWAVFVSWNIPRTPKTSRDEGNIWPLWSFWCGRWTQ